MSLLSPLRPILRNGNPLLKHLGNAFTGERIFRGITRVNLDLAAMPGEKIELQQKRPMK